MPEDVVDCGGVSIGANVQPVKSTEHSRLASQRCIDPTKDEMEVEMYRRQGIPLLLFLLLLWSLFVVGSNFSWPVSQQQYLGVPAAVLSR